MNPSLLFLLTWTVFEVLSIGSTNYLPVLNHWLNYYSIQLCFFYELLLSDVFVFGVQLILPSVYKITIQLSAAFKYFNQVSLIS